MKALDGNVEDAMFADLLKAKDEFSKLINLPPGMDPEGRKLAQLALVRQALAKLRGE
jgi:hypothetical protein